MSTILTDAAMEVVSEKLDGGIIRNASGNSLAGGSNVDALGVLFAELLPAFHALKTIVSAGVGHGC